MSLSPCFGIDLGTTCSAIGVVRDGVPQVLKIDGDELLPSVVSFPRSGPPLVGHTALNALALDPERAVLSSKRRMGSNHHYNFEGRDETPVSVAGHILRRLCEGAKHTIGLRPERAVITVPAWFTQAQRSDTRRAGELAGLTVERIINEPTAAALAHAHGQDIRRRALVYDLGGGTFDVSVVDQDGPVVEVRASHGDSQLGGDDIDLALVDLVLRKLAMNDRALRDAVDASLAARVRLRLAVEQAKIALSERVETTLRVPFLLEVGGESRHLEMTLTREELNEASLPFITRTLRSVDQVLNDAKLTPRDVDELLLVGGSTLQPLVWHLLHERYGLEGSHAIAPRRAVVLGAAIQGAIVDGSRTDGILVDVAPYSLSVGVSTSASPFSPQHYFSRVITPRNAPLPSRHTETFYTGYREQREVQIPIFQGSSSDPRRNIVLGMIRIDKLDPAPQGQPDRPIRVELRHDLDGLVQITITDVLSERSVKGQIAADGEEQAALRERLEQEWDESGLILGLDEDPSTDDEPQLSAPTLPASDLADAQLAFTAVLEARDRLEREQPAAAAELIDLAHSGQSAAASGDPDGAIALYDELSDRLFSLGVYL